MCYESVTIKIASHRKITQILHLDKRVKFEVAFWNEKNTELMRSSFHDFHSENCYVTIIVHFIFLKGIELQGI